MRISEGLAATLLLVGCSSDVTPIEDCEPAFDIEPICAFHNPEDLALLPGGGLVVSQAALEGQEGGALVRFDPGSGAVTPLFPSLGLMDRADVDGSGAAGEWGDPDCRPPTRAEFRPHGIDIVVRDDGATALLAINHGGPETVEYFAVEDGSVAWRGCVEGLGDAYWNDLVGLPDGGFVATHMMPKSGRGWSLLKALFGFDTGGVDRWRPDAGFERLAGTDMPFPNGIERSADGAFLFVGSYTGGELRKIDTASGAVVARLEIPRPDNLTWSSEGRLLLTGSTDTLSETLACGSGVVGGGCGAAFEVVAVDPETLRGELILAHRGAPMGGVSVALEVGDDLYLGSFTGDRIARWRWEQGDAR